MKNDTYYAKKSFGLNFSGFDLGKQRKLIIGLIMVVALLAFELFNFDTTKFALRSLLGDVQFAGLMWATILAIAFCAIDFAGLTRLFTPQTGADEPREVWYLMGAWLLGATMNAVMTWWAVSLTLLNHPFGNEVLSREQLLTYVPIFVAVLVWLTRILFIGAISVAGEHLFVDWRATQRNNKGKKKSTNRGNGRQKAVTQRAAPSRAVPKRTQTARASSATMRPAPKPAPKMQAAPPPPPEPVAVPVGTTGSRPVQRSSRIRQKPPMPNGGTRPMAQNPRPQSNGRH